MMEYISAIFLGLVQGLTEFLPVSSSGHLVLAHQLFPGFTQPGVLFDVILHAGTLLAVLFYFRERLFKLSPKMIGLLLVGTIPAVIFGFLLQDQLEASFGDVRSVGFQLMITGVLAYFVDRARETKKSISFVDALLIGIGQAIAIIPGISRSGTTIFTGVTRGINKKEVADFSFLLSIPAILGAIVLQVVKYGGEDSINLGLYSAGFLTSFIFGFLSIGILLKLLVSRNFKIFAVYSLILGTLVVLLA